MGFIGLFNNFTPCTPQNDTHLIPTSLSVFFFLILTVMIKTDESINKKKSQSCM